MLKNQSRFLAFSMAAWEYSVKGIIVADRTIAVSTNTAREITNYLPVNPTKVTVVPDGVELQFRQLSPETVKSWRQQCVVSSPEEICILNVGSTHQRKNIITVLKVVKAIADREIPVRLWKIGDDFTLEQKQFIRDRSLDKYVTFLAKPDREALICFYNVANVLLAPSLYEGFGLTILEGMACGLPAIASNVSSLPEIAGDAAIVVNGKDVESLTTHILRLQKDVAHRQKLIEQGLARAKIFIGKETAAQIADIYEKTVVQKSKL